MVNTEKAAPSRRPRRMKRGIGRWLGLVLAVGSAFLLTSCDPAYVEFIVTLTADLPDADPGDGVCEATVGVGDCTLRAAVMEANALDGTQAVILGDEDYALTIDGDGEDGASTGDLDLVSPINVTGNGAIIDASALASGDRVFEVFVGEGQALFSGLTITGGADANGAGLRIRTGGIAELLAVTVTGNTGGSAVHINSGGTLATLNSTIADNDTIDAVRSSGDTELAWSTVVSDSNAVRIFSGLVDLEGSIVLGDLASCIFVGGITQSAGHNFDGDGTCLATSSLTDRDGSWDLTDPELGPLADNGGPTATLLPHDFSPVRDVGGDCPTIDQRGVTRPQDGACDAGAVEIDGPPFTYDLVALGHGAFAGAGKSVLASPDGLHWRWIADFTGSQTPTAIASGQGQYVAVGNNQGIWTSPNAVDWTLRTPLVSGTFHEVAYDGAGLWVALRSSHIYTSPDGITWTERPSPVSSGNFSDLEYADGTWVTLSGNGELVTSTNGLFWTAETVEFPGIPDPIAADLTDIAFDGVDTWLVHGELDGVDQLWHSTDLENWISPASGTPEGQIHYTGGQWIALGDDVHVSSDGDTWTTYPLDPNGPSTITSVDGTYVGIGDSDSLWTSPDGYTWTRLTAAGVKIFRNVSGIEDFAS